MSSFWQTERKMLIYFAAFIVAPGIWLLMKRVFADIDLPYILIPYAVCTAAAFVLNKHLDNR